MNKLYVIKQNGNYALVKANHQPVYFVTDKFEGQVCRDIECFDVVDDIDPDTLEVIGKKAVFNQAKFDAKELARTNAEIAAQATKAQDTTERNEVLAIDLTKITDPDVRKALQWLIKRAK